MEIKKKITNNTMKKSFVFCLLIFISVFTYGQKINKLRAESMSITFKKEDGTWKQWSNWFESDVLATIINEQKRIILYTDPKEVYDIIEQKSDINEIGGETIQILCIDNKGVTCIIRMIYDSDYNLQLQIVYEKMIVAYKVKSLD